MEIARDHLRLLSTFRKLWSELEAESSHGQRAIYRTTNGVSSGNTKKKEKKRIAEPAMQMHQNF